MCSIDFRINTGNKNLFSVRQIDLRSIAQYTGSSKDLQNYELSNIVHSFIDIREQLNGIKAKKAIKLIKEDLELLQQNEDKIKSLARPELKYTTYLSIIGFFQVLLETSIRHPLCTLVYR